MARVRLTAKLNPGGEGVKLDKISKFSGELEEFLRSLLVDIGVSVSVGDWIAKDFVNGSLEFSNELSLPVQDAVLSSFNDSVRYFVSFDEDRSELSEKYSERTVKKFIDLGSALDSDEHVPIGLYRYPDDAVEWVPLRRRPALELERVATKPIRYLGDIHGRLSTWYKESSYFNVRDKVTGSLVKCQYSEGLYEKIHHLYEDKDAFVYVYGMISALPIGKLPKEVSVSDVRVFDRLSDAEFDRISGVSPDLTGDEPTDAYIDRIRRG